MLKFTEASLWKLFRDKLFDYRNDSIHYCRIETATLRGLPDVNICANGKELWVELKIATGNKVNVSPEQEVFHTKRAMAGGITYFLVRKDTSKEHILYLFKGCDAMRLATEGLLGPDPVYMQSVSGSSPKFDWNKLFEVMFKEVVC